MRTCSRLIARRSNQVIYAMPVSKAMMMTSARTTSISRSNTCEKGLLAQRICKRRMFVGHERTQHVKARWRRTDAKLLADAGHDGPIGARVRWRRSAALLVLQTTFEVDQRRLAFVGMRHRQHDVDSRIVGHWLRRGQDNARERSGMEIGPRLVADCQHDGRGEHPIGIAACQV